MTTNRSIAFDDRRIERRRPRPLHQLPIETLEQMPALVVLERLPAPALAVDRVGTILFANGAFCDMLGYSSEELLSMQLEDIFARPPTVGPTVALAPADADQLVELTHNHGHPVWARISKSAMHRSDDTVALLTFEDRTDELWLNSFAP